MKKAISIITCCLAMCLLFIGCSNTVSTEKREIKIVENCVESYFLCYEKGDFEGMKKFCSKSFVEEYFHNDDVFGNKIAKLISFNDIKYDENTKKYIAVVQVECIPTEKSALYNKDKPNDPVNTYISFVLNVDNKNALIESFSD